MTNKKVKLYKFDNHTTSATKIATAKGVDGAIIWIVDLRELWVGSSNAAQAKLILKGALDVSINNDTLTINHYNTDGTTTTDTLNIGDKVTTISSSSTDNQYPSAKCVADIMTDGIGLDGNMEYSSNETLIANEDTLHDAVDVLASNLYDKVINVVAYANSLIEEGVVTPIPYVPSLVYAPEVITDTTSTTVTLNPLKGNAVYIFTQPLTELNIITLSGLYLETTIYFTTHATTTFSYSFPQGMYKGSVITFNKDTHYCLSIKDGVAVLEKIDKYLDESTFIFSSEQLIDGVLKSMPDIVEVSGSTPVIANTQPYTIYKFGEVTSLTMQQIPANTLETIAYFSAGSTAVNLVLSGVDPLKLSSGSVASLANGDFCLVIKDGVVVITEIKEM